jgi:hypothetical protein
MIHIAVVEGSLEIVREALLGQNFQAMKLSAPRSKVRFGELVEADAGKLFVDLDVPR